MKTKLLKKGFVLGLVVIGLAALIAINTTPAHATAMASGTARIDWSSLDITTSQGMALNWYGQSTKIEAFAQQPAYVNQDHYYNVFPGWGSVSGQAQYITPTGSAQGSGSAVIGTSSNNLIANGSASSTNADVYRGEGWIYRSAGFVVGGDGMLTITVDYYVDQVTLSTTNPGEQSFADPSFELYTNYEDSDHQIISDFDRTIFHYGQLTPGTTSWSGPAHGTLTVSLNYTNGEYGYFYAGVGSPTMVAPTSVPEPSVMLLLGTGLIGLLGFRMKIKK